jgi:ABC-2 type transport system permease protein
MSKVMSLALAMWKAFVRDRASIFFTIFFPLMFLVLFGGIFKSSSAPKVSVLEVGQVAVLDQIPKDTQAQLAKVFTITKTTDQTVADQKVRKGDYAAAISQQGDTVDVHYSAADQVRAAAIQTIMRSVVQEENQSLSGTPPKFTISAQQVEDQSLKTIQFYTPGLLGWALALGGTFGAALMLVNWRKKHLLRRLRLSPATVYAVLAARMLVSVLIALGQMAIFILVATIPYFGLKLSADWWMAIPLVIAGTLAFLSLGLVVGAFAKTEEATNGIIQLIVLPMAFLSGSFFPLDSAPGWLQTVSKLMPLRYLVDALRDVMVRGRDWYTVLPTIGVLLAFAVVVSAFASRLFRWDTA